MAFAAANNDLDRLILARGLMNWGTKECRPDSKLPELVELFLSRPLVTLPDDTIDASLSPYCHGWEGQVEP